MNRINICKNIIQSIHDYITNQDNLDAYREKNRFVRKRKLSIFHVIIRTLVLCVISYYYYSETSRVNGPYIVFFFHRKGLTMKPNITSSHLTLHANRVFFP